MSSHDRKIDYIEFPATDLETTRSFYQLVFGWTFTDYGPEYTSFEDGRLSGGFDTTRLTTSGGPLVVLYSKDLDSVKNAIAARGGTIVKDIFEFPGGRRFHFKDPSGNELAVWSE